MDYFPFTFTGLIEAHDLGTYRYTVIWLPLEIAEQLPLSEYPRLRISGELNDHPFTGAWQPSRGRWYLMLGKPLLKATGLTLDCLAELRFRVEDQESLEIPPELSRALAGDEEASSRWNSLSAGKRRALCHHVSSAKSTATQSRRVRQALAWLSTGETDLRQLPRQLA